MNCREFWESLPEVGEEHPHLESCPACALRMGRQRELAGGLRTLAKNLSSTGAPSRVERRLLTAFRAQAGIAQSAPTRRRWIPALTWAAAFAAMLALGVVLMRDRTQEVQRAPVHRVEMGAAWLQAGPEPADDEGFLPLPGAAQLAPSEDVSVLHVELPRSAMMQVGIEVNPESAGEPVRADVKVGSDGMARAVRFVEAGSDD
jgi:hypothetical protein